MARLTPPYERRVVDPSASLCEVDEPFFKNVHAEVRQKLLGAEVGFAHKLQPLLQLVRLLVRQ